MATFMDNIKSAVGITGADDKKPTPEPVVEDKTTTTPDQPSDEDLLTRAKLATEAAQSAVTHQTDKVVPAVAGATANTLDSVKHVGEGVGAKVKEADVYLREKEKSGGAEGEKK